jgi:hypothetical protein
MSKGAFNIFALVINFLTCYNCLFEAKGIVEIHLANELLALFEEYKLVNKIICYEKMMAQIYLQ